MKRKLAAWLIVLVAVALSLFLQRRINEQAAQAAAQGRAAQAAADVAQRQALVGR